MTTPHQPQPHTDGIPDDVWEIAVKHFDTMERSQEIPMLCRAILAERERCAGVAKAWKGHPVDFHFAGKQIAAAIRSPSTTQSQTGRQSDDHAN